MQVRFAANDEQGAVEELAKTHKESKGFVNLWRRFGNWGKANPVIAVEETNEIIGLHVATFGTRNHTINSYYQLVKDGHRGKGIGGQMVEFVLSHGKSVGCTRLKMKTPYDTDGETFWRNFGIKPFGLDDKHYLFDIDLVNVNCAADLKNAECLEIPEKILQAYVKKGVQPLAKAAIM